MPLVREAVVAAILAIVVGALPPDTLAAAPHAVSAVQCTPTSATTCARKAGAKKKGGRQGKQRGDVTATPPATSTGQQAPHNDVGITPGSAPTETSSTPAPTDASPRVQRRRYPDMSPRELLTRAKSLYANLEYGDVIPLAEELVERPEATIDERLDAYLLQGSALSVVGDPVEAEKPFRFLLRGRADFDMSPDTPPKILAVFRKVQVEERSIVEQMRELARQRTIREIELLPKVPHEIVGGNPVDFACRIKDPHGAVNAAGVYYRRTPDEPYSSLAMQVNESGAWVARLPGQTTENEQGLVIDYYLVTRGADTLDLVTVGAPQDPLRIAVAPGRIEIATPFYRSWWFWGGTIAAVAVAGVSGYFTYTQANEPPPSDGVIDFR